MSISIACGRRVCIETVKLSVSFSLKQGGPWGWIWCLGDLMAQGQRPPFFLSDLCLGAIRTYLHSGDVSHHHHIQPLHPHATGQHTLILVTVTSSLRWDRVLACSFRSRLYGFLNGNLDFYRWGSGYDAFGWGGNGRSGNWVGGLGFNVHDLERGFLKFLGKSGGQFLLVGRWLQPLLKKEDPHKLDNYRPISLLPAFSKIQLHEYFN